MRALNEPRKGFVPLFLTCILFGPIKNDLLSCKPLKRLTNVFTGLSGSKTKSLGIIGNLDFADPIVFLKRTIRLSYLLDEEIKHPFLIAGKAICRLSQLIRLHNSRTIFTFFMIYNRNFRHGKSIQCVTVIQIVTLI